MTVSGLTMTRISAQRGQQSRSLVQKNLSSRFNCGRGRLRLKTADCCRNAKIFDGGVAPTAEESPEDGDEGKDRFEHGPSLLPWGNGARLLRPALRKLLISDNDGLLAKDTDTSQTWPKLASVTFVGRNGCPVLPSTKAQTKSGD